MGTNLQLKKSLGPLWKLFSDSTIHEFVLDSWCDIHYVQKGEIKKASKLFKDQKSYELFVSNLIKINKLPLNQEHYYFSLNDFTKVNIVLPPVALNGPSINIMKIPEKEVTLDDLVQWEALDRKGKALIEDILKNNEGVLVAGNIGSGKTTLLNTLIKYIPEPSRVVTLERNSDLIVKRPMSTRLMANSRKPEAMVELLNIAENMRADYIVLNDARGPEVMPFIDFVRHNCSGMALISATDVIDAIKRLETKALISSEGMSLEDVRYAISQAFTRIIFQERLPDGKRKVTNISSIVYESGELKLKLLYKQ